MLGTPHAAVGGRKRLGAVGEQQPWLRPQQGGASHCSNLPKHVFRSVKMDFQEIIAGTVGKENTFGTCVGLIKPEKMSFARFSTDDTAGKMRGYVGEGRFTDDPLNTFGGAGVVEIPQMQKLLHYICENGFEHHVAANLSSVAPAVYEATTRYLHWDMYLSPTTTRPADGDRSWSRFWNPERRVSIADSERGLLDSAVAEYPAPQTRRSGIRHPIARRHMRALPRRARQ